MAILIRFTPAGLTRLHSLLDSFMRASSFLRPDRCEL
jgi:hypothetical protein